MGDIRNLLNYTLLMLIKNKTKQSFTITIKDRVCSIVIDKTADTVLFIRT